MKKQLTILGLSAVLFAIACNNTTEEKGDSTSSDTLSKPVDNTLALLQGSCFSCHNPDRAAAVKIAPTLADIREVYMTDGISKEDFISSIINFVHQPGESNNKMPDAVSKYGIMPKLSYKDEDLQKMAAYIYHNDLSTDEWYTQWKAHKDIPAAVNPGDMSYEDLGLSIANGTKAQLGKNLMGAIKQHGAAGAVTFCNTRAIPLTDSMAKVYNASIKRVSDKPRNPDNNANDAELAYINELKEALANGETLQPKVTEIDGRLVGYYAIETNQMCMQCHGSKDGDILPETFTNIISKYPDDKATGYTPNQIRGIWVVSMNKK